MSEMNRKIKPKRKRKELRSRNERTKVIDYCDFNEDKLLVKISLNKMKITNMSITL